MRRVLYGAIEKPSTPRVLLLKPLEHHLLLDLLLGERVDLAPAAGGEKWETYETGRQEGKRGTYETRRQEVPPLPSSITLHYMT